MRCTRRIWLALVVVALGMAMAVAPVSAQQKPNILFIMGDDIGWMQPAIYHRGLMVGETPNIDRIGNEGAIFMHYYAEQSCTAGRNAFSRPARNRALRNSPWTSWTRSRNRSANRS
jgi:arylsulfatase